MGILNNIQMSLIDRMSENREKPSGKRMNSQQATVNRETPYSRGSYQENIASGMPPQQQQYSNYGMQPRVQPIKPASGSNHMGDFGTEYTSSAQASYGKPPSGQQQARAAKPLIEKKNQNEGSWWMGDGSAASDNFKTSAQMAYAHPTGQSIKQSPVYR